MSFLFLRKVADCPAAHWGELFDAPPDPLLCWRGNVPFIPYSFDACEVLLSMPQYALLLSIVTLTSKKKFLCIRLQSGEKVGTGRRWGGNILKLISLNVATHKKAN